MHTIEAANLDSATHRPIPKAELPKLPDRDNPVLFLRVLADQCIYPVNSPPMGRIRSVCVRFRPVDGLLEVMAGHGATLAGLGALVVR